MIPEAVLGTKETSDKARTAAFDLIIVMGKKMSEGGVVKRDMMEGMDEDAPMEGSRLMPSSFNLVLIQGPVQRLPTLRNS